MRRPKLEISYLASEPAFRTKNLALASFLVTNQLLKLKSCERHSDQEAIFVFEDPTQRATAIGLQYEAASVPAAQFIETFRRLKRMASQSLTSHIGDSRREHPDPR